MWQTKYALAVPKNLGVNFRPCSEAISSLGVRSPWLITWMRKLVHTRPFCFTFSYFHAIDQSICTLISNLSGQPDIFQGLELSKFMAPKYGVQKNRVQKTGGFCNLFFHPIFWTLLFSCSQTDPGLQNKNSGCRLTGRMTLKFLDLINFFCFTFSYFHALTRLFFISLVFFISIQPFFTNHTETESSMTGLFVLGYFEVKQRNGILLPKLF